MFSTYPAQCEESEVAYLIDPMDEDVVKLVAFDDKGDVIPLPGCSEWDRERVNESVQAPKAQRACRTFR